ncbi:hypothetical protein M409DRAFT_67493 [Zasmidium cellare ATCC 36951]|uniref:Major facilitator superfamily (MFS) profile domain-containing protein n=1 Tax=Zasmidium cellare ATCC 36951 TaxID=1080233 RepID=A0A6A6CGE8_ZASCE|nr:uncharacterized protein M409DRAFT_67493 [Zasmidium cellare ATCC 36951]KAF2165248.1 hypothetical protein M409DRAFT_67493 [Zasmidium cellare ATCC 36951]
MAFKAQHPLRLHSPYWQNVIIGILVGLTAGLYVALNLLGAGGGKPNSAQTVQVVNAVLCTVWVFSASFGGSVLNKIGPALTACFGVISSGLIFVTMGYIAMSYSEERDRGKYITISVNLQAVGSVVAGLIALIINRNSAESTGVPAPVYIVFIVLMGSGMIIAFSLRPPSKVIRDDGTEVGVVQARTFVEEIKATLESFKDWKLLVKIPAFLPAECFLVYGGSVNAYHNNLRTRSLVSFVAVTLQIPAGLGLQMILDNQRAFAGLLTVGVPLMAAGIWEIVRVRNYDRANPPSRPLDWSDDGFVAIFFLFMLNWVASSLWQYIILYFLGTLTNSPRKSANYAGVFRGILAADEAICFGVDSIQVPYIYEAAVIFAFYGSGLVIFACLAMFCIKETEYFNGEDDVVIPKHVLEGRVVKGEDFPQSVQVQDVEIKGS